MVLCHATSKRTGKPCGAQAVNGKSVCYHHGGAPGSGRKPTHGRYSKSLPKDLTERYEYFKSDPDVKSLIPEVALARTMMERFMRTFVEDQGISAELGGELRAWFDNISKLAERCDKILNGERYTVNLEGLQAIIAQVADIVRRHVPDDAARAAIAAELAKLGGVSEA